jgi:lantibiotic modifying enzyme
MPVTRREFLSEAALAAAMTGLGPGVASVVSALGQSSRPYLDLALRCAQWIDSSAQRTASGLAWPADPLKPSAIGLDYYNGTPGVVAFFARLWRASGDPKWRDRADQGGKYLVAESARAGDSVDAGLYTGLAGLGATYTLLASFGVGREWPDIARQAARDVARRAKIVGDGVEWSDSNDIISGTAGIGLYMLDAATKWPDDALGDVAAKAGRRLLATSVPAEGGLMWFPGGSIKANYPNFSHGTSGVAYFLATLYHRNKQQEFLNGALSGVKYLDAVVTRRNGARAVFHVTGGGEDRFYLSWCHGPVGTARLFARLRLIGPDRRWQIWMDELNAWLFASGAPEQQSAGYWNNISQCCGNVGIGQYAVDLARNYRLSSFDSLRDRVVKNTMSRATDDVSGLRWVQAENRVSPQNLVAQTGFMQGAAGVGTFLLQLDALSRGEGWPTPWPDTPWV